MSLLCILVAAGAAGSPGQTASERIEELLAVYNSRERSRMARFVEARMDAKLVADGGKEEWIAQLWRAGGSGVANLSVAKMLRATKDCAVAQINDGIRPFVGVRVDLSKGRDGKIAGIEFDGHAAHLLLYRHAEFRRTGKSVAWLKKLIAETKVPALGVSWGYASRSVTIVEGFKRDGGSEPASTQDLWLIGSNGKAMTAVLAATLIEEGKLNWDSTLGDLMKDVPMRDEYKSATLEQLMQHIAGIPEDSTLTDADVARVVGDLSDPVKIRESYVKDILLRQPVGKPGERFAYSNAGYAILGHIVERILKKPFEELMVERVFKPLGMTNAKVGMPGENGMPGGKDQLSGHFLSPKGLTADVLKGPIIRMGAPAGLGVACRLEEQGRFAGWNFRGLLGEKTPVLRAETIRRLHTPLPRAGKPGSYASGWVIRTIEGMAAHTHMGSEGSFVAVVAIFPKEKLIVSTATNCGNHDAAIKALEGVVKEWRRAYTPTVDKSGDTVN